MDVFFIVLCYNHFAISLCKGGVQDIEDLVKQLTAKLKAEKFSKIHIVVPVLLLLTIMAFFSFGGSDQVLSVDEVDIAKINNIKTYEKALEIVKAEQEEILGYALSGVESQIILSSDKVFEGKKIKDPKELAEIIKPYVDCQTSAYALKVNGEEKVYLKTTEEAESLLEGLKTKFLKEGEEILSYDFKEEIEIAETCISSSKILTVANALNYVFTGTDKIETYTVAKGDTLSVIAEKHGLGLSKLREANSGIKGDMISIGQEIKLVKLEPIVQVMVAKEITVEEAIPYNTKYTSSSEVWAGQTKVKQAGENGLKKVTYKVISENGKEVEKQELKSVVLKETTTKEVLRGTQKMVASRGGGDGQLAWPLRGSITSRYGPRGSGFHTGIDISGTKGTPLYAAGNGKVIFASWSGAYGNLIIVDHGNGLTTKYAHLTSYKISLGQSVKRGDLLGTVGSTGRSTGSHLHFETNINSKHVNPTRYLGN